MSIKPSCCNLFSGLCQLQDADKFAANAQEDVILAIHVQLVDGGSQTGIGTRG